MTRAKEHLTLLHASARSLWGSRGYNLPSRFLDELPASVDRERLRPGSWSSYGAQGVAPRDDVPSLSTGDSVRPAGRSRAPRREGRRPEDHPAESQPGPAEVPGCVRDRWYELRLRELGCNGDGQRVLGGGVLGRCLMG